MWMETSSTARTPPPALAAKGESPCGKILVRLRTSTRGIPEDASRIRHPVVSTDEWSGTTFLGGECSRQASLPCGDQGHRRKCSHQANKLPAGELFFKKQTCEQHSDRGI